MKRHIIAYYGKQNSGKTTTLTLLHNMLSKALPQCDRLPYPIPSPDFRSHFLTKGYIICISTSGDNADAIRRGLEYFEQHQGHVLITAARTRGATLSTLEGYKINSPDVNLVSVKAPYAETPTEQDEANKTQAEKLFQLIFANLNIH